MIFRKSGTCYLLFFWGFVFFLLWACSEDELPNTPPAPFLFTDVDLSKNIAPVPGTTLNKGQTVNFNFKVAYTLTPGDNDNRQNLLLFIDSGGFSANNNFISIDPTPDQQMQLNAVSGIMPVSFSVTIPQNDTLTTVDVFTAILNLDSNTFLVSDSFTYPVQ